ncbi:hypothetical protein MMC34_006703 [Xylographa carneopallida]|nr:hypothetical protein [Xylographa carneopallida]
MSDTITLPLTSIFTPPSSCSSQWTYEAEYYNGVSGGLLLQNALQSDGLATACFPSGFADSGRIPSPQVFSPGACPNGYTTPVISVGGEITTGICCQTTIEYFSGSQPLLFAGCISTYASGGGRTSVIARSGDSQLSSIIVTGPLTMWGQAVTVEFQQQDLSLFSTVTATSLSPTSIIASSSTGMSTLPTRTIAASATSSSFNSIVLVVLTTLMTESSAGVGIVSTESILTWTASAPAATTSTAQSTVLPTGSQVGVSIGAAIAFVLLVCIVSILFKRRREQKKIQGASTEAFEVEASQQHMVISSNTAPYQGVLLEAPAGIIGPRELPGKHMSLREMPAGGLPD